MLCFNFVVKSVGLELDRPSHSLVIMCDRIEGLPHSSVVGRSFLKEMSWMEMKAGL